MRRFVQAGTLAVLVALGQSARAQPVDPALLAVDAVRVRGGVSGGGGFLAAAGVPVQPIVGVGGHVGVQFNRFFSTYYLGALSVAVFTDGSGRAVFNDNAILGNLTIAHRIDFGVGPSLDVVVLDSSSAASMVKLVSGVHGRAAVIVGVAGTGLRRRGVALELNLHPAFGQSGVLFTTTLGVGYEWF